MSLYRIKRIHVQYKAYIHIYLCISCKINLKLNIFIRPSLSLSLVKLFYSYTPLSARILWVSESAKVGILLLFSGERRERGTSSLRKRVRERQTSHGGDFSRYLRSLAFRKSSCCWPEIEKTCIRFFFCETKYIEHARRPVYTLYILRNKVYNEKIRD